LLSFQFLPYHKYLIHIDIFNVVALPLFSQKHPNFIHSYRVIPDGLSQNCDTLVTKP